MMSTMLFLENDLQGEQDAFVNPGTGRALLVFFRKI